MALYAFDGTGNEMSGDIKKETNIVKFAAAYDHGKPVYLKGVGTRWGWLGRIIGTTTGAGGPHRIKKAYKALKNRYEAGDTDIDIVGFSRGAALALDFANKIAHDGLPGVEKPVIRFLGLWDTVASFGIPGNTLNLGHDLEVPGNVEVCCHALALDERRSNFVPTRQTEDAVKAHRQGRVFEVWFRGVHSDVGGGNEKLGLPSISLHWMMKRARAIDVPIKDDHIATAARRMKPGMKVYDNFDIIKQGFRDLRKSDLAHHSVTARADTEMHQNPLPGMKVVDDDGKILPGGFS